MLEHAFDIEIEAEATPRRRRSGVMALFGGGKGQKEDLDMVKSVKSKRLQEAMKTKWIRRVSGFFRCSSDEKAYFARIPWDLVNMTFLDCGSLLYDILGAHAGPRGIGRVLCTCYWWWHVRTFIPPSLYPLLTLSLPSLPSLPSPG